MNTAMGYKMFLFFATINIAGMAVFSLYGCFDWSYKLLLTLLATFLIPSNSYRLIPETKGRSLEEMDIIFGSISAEQRRADIDKRHRGVSFSLILLLFFLGH